MPRLSLRWLPLAFAVALLALVGCAREDVTSYDAPKPAVYVGDVKVRLLAAIFDVGKSDQWYFKFVGPTDEITKHEDDFVKFIESVRFTNKVDKPVEWIVPAKWEQGEGGEKRYATFYPDPKDRSAVLTVHQFDMRSSLSANVNRWCDLDVGRPHIPEAALEDVATVITAGTKRGYLVKLSGPGPKKGKHPPMAGLGKDRKKPALPDDDDKPVKLPLTWTVPEGWTQGAPKAMVLTTFTVRSGDRSAELQVSSLGASFGDMVANLNRRRGQVSLPPVRSIDPKPSSIKIDGINSEYYDLNGPEGANRKRMLLVIVKRGGQAWFYKLIGDAGVVTENRAKFESFVQSVKFTGAAE